MSYKTPSAFLLNSQTFKYELQKNRSVTFQFNGSFD